METLTALIDGLADPDRESRLFRVERIVRFGAAAVEPLCAALRSGGLLTRCAAAMALGRIGDRRAVPDLIQALRSYDTALRELAVEALGKIGDPAAVPELIQTARGANAYLIIPSLEALGKIGDPRALDTLVRALRGFGQDWSIRAAAARALGELNHPAALEPLCAAMPGAPQGALVEMCRSLGALGDVRAVPALCHAARRAWELEDGESVIAAASAALVRIGDVREVAELLEQGRTAPLAVRTLAEFGKLAVPSLGAALDHPSEKVRLRALQTLDEIAETEPEAARAAVGALEDGSSEVRAAAAWVTVRLADPSVQPQLQPLLRDPDRRVRGRAALALFAGSPDAGLVPQLIEALEDPQEDPAVAAAEALAHLARERPTNALLAALPVLRRRIVFQRLPRRAIEARQQAAAAIERACSSIKHLPVPAQPDADSAALPLPARSPEPSSHNLPLPAAKSPEA